jgi:hypothetical protein
MWWYIAFSSRLVAECIVGNWCGIGYIIYMHACNVHIYIIYMHITYICKVTELLAGNQ